MLERRRSPDTTSRTSGGGTPTCHWLEYVDWADAILDEPLGIADGRAVTPDRPGIGLTWRRRRSRPWLDR